MGLGVAAVQDGGAAVAQRWSESAEAHRCAKARLNGVARRVSDGRRRVDRPLRGIMHVMGVCLCLR